MVARGVLVPKVEVRFLVAQPLIALSYIGSTPDSGSGEIGSIPVRATTKPYEMCTSSMDRTILARLSTLVLVTAATLNRRCQ